MNAETLAQGFARKLREEGIVKLDGYMRKETCDKMESELRAELSKLSDGDKFYPGKDKKPRPNAYPWGKFLAIEGNNQNLFPETKKAYSHPMFNQVREEYLGPRHKASVQTFVTNEYMKADDWSRNSFLHFDPYHALKFIIYLTDTYKDNGAFKAFPGSRQDGMIARRKTPLHISTKEGYKVSYHKDLSEKYGDEEGITYYEGQRGTLLMIDTDIIHAGSVLLKDGVERLVANNHNRK
jgi:hypothetical protein